jgi:hypothetical protein
MGHLLRLRLSSKYWVNCGRLCKSMGLHAFMGSRVVSKKAQLAVHSGVLLPILMYGSESWQKKHTSRVNAVECER